MLALLSPAKSLDFTPAPAGLTATQPELGAETTALVALAKKLRPSDIKKLMDISEKLADLNYARFQAFGTPEYQSSAKQAALAFNGDTYLGFEAKSLTVHDLLWSQERVRILSGLYGLLRPLDVIEPYRLEMGIRLANPRGPDLYAFWRGKIGPLIDSLVSTHHSPVVINVASEEYAKAMEANRLKARVITPVFREERDGQSRIIGLMAKRARGAMARFMVVNRIEKPEGLKDFTSGGYRYQPAHSDDTTWVFTRPQP